ncbi:MAG: hypothetical protein JNK23_22085 [Opitutaceae bacterium]|nr:hypothetical protein [Opitutaceae bacterium]
MKTLLVTVSLAVAGVSVANAQVFRPSVGGSAAIGAVAGGLIGGHNGDRWAEGMIIGAAAGALFGAIAAPERATAAPPPVYQAPSPGAYGQQVYGQPSAGVPDAATVPMAPTVGVPVQVVTAPPQVVYVETAPRVVYVPAPAPRVIYAAPPPVISFVVSFHSGPRHHGWHSHGHRHYRR